MVSAVAQQKRAIRILAAICALLAVVGGLYDFFAVFFIRAVDARAPVGLTKVIAIRAVVTQIKGYVGIGVYKDPNETRNRLANMNNGNLLMANTQLAVEYNAAEIMNVVVHVKKLDNVLKDGSAAARLMTKLSGVKEGEYQMLDQAGQLASIQSQIAIVQIVFGAIAGIALLVGGIGVMNIMLVSVTERTREIGLRKALGATRGNILMQFVIESMVLTAIGGLIGLALAALIVASIGHNLDSFFGAPPTITTVSAVGSVFFSATIGIIFGILPANKASKLDPIESLRYE